MQVHLTLKSGNSKVGPMPVTMTERASCPKSCPHYGTTCYAGLGPISWHWKKVGNKQLGDSWDALCDSVSQFTKANPDTGVKGQLWRHNQAGDLAGVGGRINGKLLNQLVAANKGARGFTYTHKATSPTNIAKIKSANDNGFVINASADTLAQADDFVAQGLPTVVVLPHDAASNVTTDAGNLVVICPATKNDNVSCNTCALCSVADRKTIVGFPAHGVRKRNWKLKVVK